jgi:Tol biopolymer transport system component
MADGTAASPDASPDAMQWPRHWAEPKPIVELNTANEEAQATMTTDQLEICFQSDRPGGVGGADIWCARRSSRAMPFDPPVVETTLSSTSTDWMPALSGDGAEIFFSSDRSGGAGSFDLYRAEWVPAAGAFGPPTRVAELSSAAWDSGPSLSGDALTLYFDSNRLDTTQPGNIYVATRPDRTHSFDAPVLVAALASSYGSGEPGPSPDLAMMTFCSGRPGGGFVPPEIFALWGADRSGSGWGTPYVLDIDQASGVGGCGPSLLSDGTLLFHSGRAGGLGKSDLYLAAPL